MISRKDRNLLAAYPERAAGGFSRVDGTVEFYQRINALLDPDMTVLDIGAGRGAQLLSTSSPYRTSLARLQGKVRRLVGVDPDEAVLTNPFLDEAHVVSVGARLPFPDAQFDLIYADWVLEHVADPASFEAEVRRLLKPGGWFCARTPNRWGMTGIGTNLVPNRLHVRLLKRVQPTRQEVDVFPTTYQLNTRARLRRYFRPTTWENHSYFHNPEPAYVQESRIALGFARFLLRFLPEAMHANFHIFMRAREAEAQGA